MRAESICLLIGRVGEASLRRLAPMRVLLLLVASCLVLLLHTIAGKVADIVTGCLVGDATLGAGHSPLPIELPAARVGALPIRSRCLLRLLGPRHSLLLLLAEWLLVVSSNPCLLEAEVSLGYERGRPAALFKRSWGRHCFLQQGPDQRLGLTSGRTWCRPLNLLALTTWRYCSRWGGCC